MISASGFGGGLTTDGLSDDMITIGSAAVDANTRFIYDSSTGGLFFDADGTGESKQVQFAVLSPDLNLSSSDFSIIA